ncbi:hypothetical protein MEZE111188_01815 [Mesobacillus zeae]
MTLIFLRNPIFHHMMNQSTFYHLKLLIAKYEDLVIGGATLLTGKQATHYHL